MWTNITMRTITVNLYQFNELSEEAQKVALDEFRDREFPWFEEIKETMNGFAILFSVHVTSYSLGYDQGAHISFGYNQYDLESIKGMDLWHWINNSIDEKYWNQEAKKGSCPLTGVCYDGSILDPVCDFMKAKDINSTTTFDDLVKDCFDNLVKAVSDECLHQYGDEATKEFIEANEYEFTTDGKHY